jgi:hypothetical protein
MSTAVSAPVRHMPTFLPDMSPRHISTAEIMGKMCGWPEIAHAQKNKKLDEEMKRRHTMRMNRRLATFGHHPRP